jgi:hypothetical protein
MLVVLISGCAEPTEIFLSLETNVPCEAVRGFSYAVANSTDISSALVTRRLESGSAKFSCTQTDFGSALGTMGIIPKQKLGSDIGLRIALSVTPQSVGPLGDVCIAGSTGCIHQQAIVSYVPSRTVKLTLTLNSECGGVICPADSSCFTGSCQLNHIVTSCDATSCEAKSNAIDTQRTEPVDSGVPHPIDSGMNAAGDGGVLNALDSGVADAGLFQVGFVVPGALQGCCSADFVNATRVESRFTGTAASISVYIGIVDPNPLNQRFQMAVYEDRSAVPGALMAVTPIGTLLPNDWNTLPISFPVVKGAAYWLGYNTNATQQMYNNRRYNLMANTRHIWAYQPFGSFPLNFMVPFEESTSAENMSMYFSGRP